MNLPAQNIQIASKGILSSQRDGDCGRKGFPFRAGLLHAGESAPARLQRVLQGGNRDVDTDSAHASAPFGCMDRGGGTVRRTSVAAFPRSIPGVPAAQVFVRETKPFRLIESGGRRSAYNVVPAFLLRNAKVERKRLPFKSAPMPCRNFQDHGLTSYVRTNSFCRFLGRLG